MKKAPLFAVLFLLMTCRGAWPPSEGDLGVYNVKAFGAVGDGQTDDSEATAKRYRKP